MERMWSKQNKSMTNSGQSASYVALHFAGVTKIISVRIKHVLSNSQLQPQEKVYLIYLLARP